MTAASGHFRPPSSNSKQFIFDALSLRTAGGRLAVFAILSVAIFFSRYSWLAHLSLWQALGLHWAPSIGLTRAYWLLLHGQPVASWHRNALIYAVLAVGIPLLIKDAYTLLRHAIITPNSRKRALVAQLDRAEDF